ncbi:MAG: RNA 2',3'-cyclic phosphodiesterase [Phycisphaerae bacterium]|nr:RNA 2',3'-cyclic phosphodiesterase [Phycisphaerae bacterium]
MRLFVAVDINSQVRDRIEQVQRQLKRDMAGSDRGVKWVRPEQIHLTLKFLGEVPDRAITQVCDVVTRTAARHDRFEMQVQGLGVFGNPARVVWAGVEPCPALMTLQAELESEFETIGWDKEGRAFAGHLTLCRVKNAAAGRKIAQAVETVKDEIFGSVWVDQAVLYESRLSSDGPEYSAVCTAPLK